MKISHWLAIGAAALLLSACGGRDDDASGGGTTPAPPPVVSGGSNTGPSPAMAFISYLQTLVVSMADTLEPADSSAVVAVADDNGEPVAVN
jgi:hypothetical protein